MSLVLAFDCAVAGLSVAVLRGAATLAVHRAEGRDQAATLVPAIAATLDRAGVARRDLALLAVTVGPGSFTGVRVGLATARGLAVALGLPLAGITTTATLLAQAATDDRLAAAAIDTHLRDWFCAVAEGDAAPFLATTDALAGRLNGRACRIVGPQADALAPKLGNAVAQVVLPEAETVARLALAGGVEHWRERNRLEGLPRPLYLRGVNITSPDGARRTVE